MKTPIYSQAILRDLLHGPVLLSSIKGPKWPVDIITKLRKDIRPSGRDIVGRKVKIQTRNGIANDVLYELVKSSPELPG